MQSRVYSVCVYRTGSYLLTLYSVYTVTTCFSSCLTAATPWLLGSELRTQSSGPQPPVRESQWWTSGTRKQQRNSEISWQTVTGRQRERGGACHVRETEHGCDPGWPPDSWQRPGEWPEAGAGEQETLVIVWFRGNTGHRGELQVKQQPDFQYKVQPSQAGTETGTDWPGLDWAASFSRVWWVSWSRLR